MKTLRTLKGFNQEKKHQIRLGHRDGQPVHMAYYLCYPFMLDRKETGMLSLPGDRRHAFDSEAG